MKVRRGSGDSLLIIILLLAAGYWYFYMGGAGIIQPNSVVNVVTVTYADGSVKVYDSPSLVPNIITQVGGTVAISSIKFDTKVTPTFPVGTTSVSGVTWTIGGQVTTGKTGAAATNRLTIAALPSLPTTLTSGVQVTVASTTITEAQLLSWIPLDYTNYDLKAAVTVDAGFIPPGQTTGITIGGSQTSTVAVKNAGFPATLTVTISPTVNTK
jgi:hypothetical protein